MFLQQFLYNSFEGFNLMHYNNYNSKIITKLLSNQLAIIVILSSIKTDWITHYATSMKCFTLHCLPLH